MELMSIIAISIFMIAYAIDKIITSIEFDKLCKNVKEILRILEKEIK